MMKELRVTYGLVVITSFLLTGALINLYCYLFNLHAFSILGVLISTWIGLWYVCMLIVFTHLFCFIQLLDELLIKEDIKLLLKLLFIYFFPPIYLIANLESDKIFFKLDQLINEFI